MTEELLRVVEDYPGQIAGYRAALTEILEGKGRYSRDQLEHASNTIEDMKEIAREALAKKE